MAVSCDDEELNKLIVSAFQAHYDDMVEAMTVCAGKIARLLYQNGKISIETMTEASEAGGSIYRRSMAIVNAISVYIKTRDTSSKSLEMLDILGKQTPVDGVVIKMRRHMQRSSPASSFEIRRSIEEESTYSNELPRTNSNEPNVSNGIGRTNSNNSNQMTNSMDSIDSNQMSNCNSLNSVERMDSNDSNASFNSVFSSSSRPPLTRSFRLSSNASRNFTVLKFQFSTLKRTAKRLIGNSPEKFSDLKDQLLDMYPEDLNTCSIVRQAASTEELLEKVVFPRCTLIDYSLLDMIAQYLKIPEILYEIEVFTKSWNKLQGNLLEGEFAEAVKSEISQHVSNPDLPKTVIELSVKMKASEATLKEFRSLIEEIFPLLYHYIELKMVEEGSVCFICTAPKYLEDVLIQMAKDQIEVAVRRKVIILKVGMVSIIEEDVSAIEPVFEKSEKTLQALLTEQGTASLSSGLPTLPSPPVGEDAVSQPREKVVQEETISPSLPSMPNLPQVNVVTSSDSRSDELGHDFPWERLLTWSSLSLLVLSLLAVYYSGNGEVVCDSPPHLSSSFVNKACQQSSSRWSYYPLFVFLQSIVLLLPQYLWYSYSKWHVQFFFSALQRFNRHPFTAEGECELEAFEAVVKLDKQFSKSDGLVRLYVRKLVLQVILWALCCVTTLMFFGKFKCPKSNIPTRFGSPRRDCDIEDSPFIDCFYSQIQNLVAANFFILLISLASIVYGFKWFFLQPVKSLQQSLEFCLNSHLSPEHFIFDGFTIAHASDLDFLFQLLDYVDSDLVTNILAVHIRRHMHIQLSEQFELFRLMKNVQSNGFLKGVDGSDDKDDIRARERHLMYGFKSEVDIDRELHRVYHRLLGVEIPPLPSVYKLIYQCLHHAVLPKDKDCAVEINFGTPEYGTALGRIFLLVVSVCFLSQLRDRRITSKNTKERLSHTRITLPDTIYTQPYRDTNAANAAVRDMVLDDVMEEDRVNHENRTVINFIIVGPIQEKKNCNTANMLLDHLYRCSCYNRTCCLLTLRPVKIGGHDVDHLFHKFVPIERMFELDDEKLQKETSEDVTIPCGTQQSDTQNTRIGLKPEPLECVFEIKLYRFRNYSIGHNLYNPPVTEDNPPPQIDNTLMN